MTNPNYQPGSGEKVEVIKGMFFIPDFEDPKYHDGSLAHITDFKQAGAELGAPAQFTSRAFLQTYATAVRAADQQRLASRFKAESFASRSVDWRFNPRGQSDIDLQKRLRIFMTNELVADTFYDHIVPTSTDWPSQYLDVIEALLKSRGYDQPSEKRTAQLARRESLA